ncbi:competence protein ComQ [Paenibacillus sp. yr247]|uniref:polyprenyl synthetase family protein n=1 Tax=Paenibacillus sp. yr247 TaxID=1761880 RepID=UPI00088DF1FD|nr:polyprenyl synthetase family protein [Paenibacillus sp. yr247]SDM85181.1 competence protein ComQ [Paenibacillus sp. yr247]
MHQRVISEMYRIIDVYFHVTDLNALLKTFVKDKISEGGSIWSDFTINCHHMLGGGSPDIYAAAAQTELIILSLDIMDDLQDQDNSDKPWMTCDRTYALNAIIAFLMASIGEISQNKATHMTEVLQLIARSINGQHRDLNHSVATENDYITMVQEKSSSLIHLSFCMGYLGLEECDPAILAHINEIAQYVGLAAQLNNDTRDITRIDQKNDILQKKKTLPILYLLKQSEDKFPPLHQYYNGLITREELIELKFEYQQYINESGCIEYAKTIQFLFANKAEELLESLPIDSPWKDKLKETVMAAVG